MCLNQNQDWKVFDLQNDLQFYVLIFKWSSNLKSKICSIHCSLKVHYCKEIILFTVSSVSAIFNGIFQRKSNKVNCIKPLHFSWYGVPMSCLCSNIKYTEIVGVYHLRVTICSPLLSGWVHFWSHYDTIAELTKRHQEKTDKDTIGNTQKKPKW